MSLSTGTVNVGIKPINLQPALPPGFIHPILLVLHDAMKLEYADPTFNNGSLDK